MPRPFLLFSFSTGFWYPISLTSYAFFYVVCAPTGIFPWNGKLTTFPLPRPALPLSTLDGALGAPPSFPAEVLAVSSYPWVPCIALPCVAPSKGCIDGICCWHIWTVPSHSHRIAC